MMKTFSQWIKENTARTAMGANYPPAYFAGQYPPLAVTPISSDVARAYTYQYKRLLKNLLNKSLDN